MRWTYGNSDPNYEHGASLFPAEGAFSDRIAQLRQGLAKRRDPVLCLPPEIITRIFEYAPEQRLTSRGVSHTWRNALDHLPIWRHVTIRRDCSKRLSQCNSRQLTLIGLKLSPEHVPMLGQQLQHLTWSTFYPSRYVIEALATNNCTQLHSLDLVLKNSPVRDTFLELCRFPARALMAPHLTELTLDVHYGHRYSLLHLLASLPQLASLKYTHRSHDGSTDKEVLFSGPSFPTGPHRLQRLQCLCASWSDSDLKHLPAMLPELESLVIEQVEDGAIQDILGAFMQQSKKLKTLVWAYDVGPLLDTLPSTFTHLSTSITTTNNTKPHESGLPSGTRHVILGQSIQVPSTDIRGFLQRSQHTLEALQFEGREPGLFEPTLVFQQLSFSQLRYLSLYSCFAPVTDSLPGLLTSCPNLEELSLFYVDLLLDDDALAIAGLGRLHTLTIENCYYDSEFLPALFHQIMTLGCPVTDLTVIDGVSEEGMITEIMLAQLGDIASLKKIVLDANVTITSDHIETFLEHAQNSGLAQSLRHLDMCRSSIAMKPQWLVLLNSTFPAAHIIPRFIFPKILGGQIL